MRYFITKTTYLMFCFLILLTPVSAQIKIDSLTQRLQSIFQKDSLPGLSVVLVNNKGIIYQKGFGFADIENAIPFTAATVQNIGSVSKTFTAVALMKAIELKYFTLETDINDILPFKIVNPNDLGAKITVRQLTNHTSGIIDNPATYPNTYLFYPKMAPYSEAAFSALKSLGYEQKIVDQPMRDFFRNYLSPDGKYYSKDNFGPGKTGRASRYSNIASALAAYLIEVKSGLTYAQFTQQYILKPLKMTRSGWPLVKTDIKHYAKPYFNLKQSFPFYSWITYPEGGLRTSAADLSKYLIEMIRSYQGKGLILSQASVKTMFTPQFSAVNMPDGLSLKTRNKGIFWNLYNNGTIGHDGDDPGVSTFLFFNTRTGLGGIFICNKYLTDKQPIIDQLVNATN